MNLETTKKNITAIILCGGEGQRLRPITEEIPKPLIKIKNNPILYYIIEHLKKCSYISTIVFREACDISIAISIRPGRVNAGSNLL